LHNYFWNLHEHPVENIWKINTFPLIFAGHQLVIVYPDIWKVSRYLILPTIFYRVEKFSQM